MVNPYCILQPYLLKVEGVGRIKTEPDMAIVILGVVTENKQLQLSQQENAGRIDSILKTLTEKDVSSGDVKTFSYSITPQCDYVDGSQVFRGYRVEHLLQITIRDIKRVGEIIDAAVQSGANQVNNIRFSVGNPSLYYQQALNEAVGDAFLKAGTLEARLNVSVSRVPVRIIERAYDTGNEIKPLTLQAEAATTPVQPGQIDITARIEAIFTYWH